MLTKRNTIIALILFWIFGVSHFMPDEVNTAIAFVGVLFVGLFLIVQAIKICWRW